MQNEIYIPFRGRKIKFGGNLAWQILFKSSQYIPFEMDAIWFDWNLQCKEEGHRWRWAHSLHQQVPGSDNNNNNNKTNFNSSHFRYILFCQKAKIMLLIFSCFWFFSSPCQFSSLRISLAFFAHFLQLDCLRGERWHHHWQHQCSIIEIYR